MKKLKLLGVIAASLALAAFVLAGCGSSNTASSSSASGSASADASASASATDTTKLIVGFDAAYPPYGFKGDDGNYTGFDIDLATEVASRNGWELELSPIDWDAKDALLNADNINCIWNGFTMEGREGDYTFSEPYMLNGQVVVVKAGSDIAALADLEGKTVMTQADSAALELFEGDLADMAAGFAGGAVQTIGDYQNAFMQLDSGMVDAVACDLSVAQYYLAASPDKYAQLDESLSSEHYAVGFKLGNTELADAVNATLKEMYEDGTVETLCEKYAEYGISYDLWVLK